MDKATQKKIQDLEKQGFKVKRAVATIKKTFELPADLVERFTDHCRKNKIKIKDATEMALESYLKSGGT